MVHIQMTDRNPSDLEFIEELTDGELLAINGSMPVHMSHGNHLGEPHSAVRYNEGLGITKRVNIPFQPLRKTVELDIETDD